MRIRLVATGLVGLLLSSCAPYDGYSYSPSYDSPSSSSYSSPSSDSSSYTSVRNDGTIVERKSYSDGRSERTIVHPNGGVTIIQRDSDGTRTTVDSDGNVRVDPPGRW